MGKRKKGRKQAFEESQPPSKKQRVSGQPMPEGVHHYETIEEVPWDIQK
jgi:hypothetical protein